MANFKDFLEDSYFKDKIKINEMNELHMVESGNYDDIKNMIVKDILLLNNSKNVNNRTIIYSKMDEKDVIKYCLLYMKLVYQFKI